MHESPLKAEGERPILMPVLLGPEREAK